MRTKSITVFIFCMYIFNLHLEQIFFDFNYSLKGVEYAKMLEKGKRIPEKELAVKAKVIFIK